MDLRKGDPIAQDRGRLEDEPPHPGSGQLLRGVPQQCTGAAKSAIPLPAAQGRSPHHTFEES
eukprot:221786-Hanusia_phi.AAC.1